MKCEICQCPDRVWLKTGEVAAVLGCTARTVRNMLEDGRLAGIRWGRERRVKHAALHAYLDNGQQLDIPVEPVRPSW